MVVTYTMCQALDLADLIALFAKVRGETPIEAV